MDRFEGILSFLMAIKQQRADVDWNTDELKHVNNELMDHADRIIKNISYFNRKNIYMF